MAYLLCGGTSGAAMDIVHSQVRIVCALHGVSETLTPRLTCNGVGLHTALPHHHHLAFGQAHLLAKLPLRVSVACRLPLGSQMSSPVSLGHWGFSYSIWSS